jgi:hypothetical protein
VNEIELLRAAFADVPEPGQERVAYARATLLDLIASIGSQRRPVRGATSRLRVVVLVLAALLVLAAIATAALGVHVWLSSAPRGAQYASGYRLADVFAVTDARGSEWSSFALTPEGHDLYAIRTAPNGGEQEVMRISSVDRGTRLQAKRVLAYRAFEHPGWPLGRGGSLAVAPGGGLLLVVPGADTPARPARRGRGGSLELVAVRPDGSRQVVVTAGELVRQGLFPVGSMTWQLAASASDRVWLFVGPAEGNGPQRLLEIADPNSDGDWSDRVVRPIALPASVPFARQAMRPFTFEPEWSWRLTAEPGRAHSVLATVVDAETDDFRVYRITDQSPTRVQLLLHRRLLAGDWPTIAPTDNGLAIGGMTRGDRVSLVSRSGVIAVIGRSFPLVGLLAGPGGALYPITRTLNGAQSRFVIYRLQPGGGSASGAPVGSSPATATGPAGGPVPRLVFEEGGSAFTVGANGAALQRLLSDRHVHDVCESVDRSAVAFQSDTEAPGEFFPYAARLDGGEASKVSERQVTGFGCPFAARYLLLSVVEGFGPGYTLLRQDSRIVAAHVDRFALSPDGTKLAYVGGVAFHGDTRLSTSRETLQLVDLTTLHQTRLAGPLLSRSGFGIVDDAFGLQWSPDSRRIAYVVEPNDNPNQVPHASVLWARDTSGHVLLRLPLTGGMPSAAWSPDGRRLLVCIEARGFAPSCPAGPGNFAYVRFARRTAARLLLVDLDTGAARVVARGALLFTSWAPSGKAFAYATNNALYLETTAGSVSRLATAPGPGWAGMGWPGFSPDGRYLAIARDAANGIPVVDLRRRRVLVLRPLGARAYENVQWWR